MNRNYIYSRIDVNSELVYEIYLNTKKLLFCYF